MTNFVPGTKAHLLRLSRYYRSTAIKCFISNDGFYLDETLLDK